MTGRADNGFVRLLVLCCVVLLCSACSTKKNTAGTRFYHSVVARFNTLHNGRVAFEEGLAAQEKSHQDDYTALLPMYISMNKQTANAGRSNYDTSIEKCEKAIKLHSIKKKPTVSGNHKLTPKEKEYRARKEFNPYLYHAWLMFGEAQFNQGEFLEAASTFHYILRLYATQPDVVCLAKAWLARCYIAVDWPYDAEDVLNKMGRDSITTQGERARQNSMAAYYVQTGQYAEAIPYLQKTIDNTHRKLPKARLNFLMGQLYHELGDDEMAYKYLGRVIRSNPPYELAFNARILQSEVTGRKQYKAMVKKLQRMAKSDKNKDYLDRVYFALGNIHLAVNDTTKCIEAYEKGVEESTKNGVAKAILLLRLSEIYWGQENYIDAQRTYKLCIAILDKEHESYKESERRSKILDELAPPLQDIKLQDSLQALSKLPEKDCLAAIDRVIEDLKKKEKEEAKKAARNGTGANGTAAANNMAQNNVTTPTAATATGQQKGLWYFYNPMSVNNGRQEFQRRWGQRPNEDNWRRSNKQVQSGNEFEETNYDDEENEELYGSLGDEGEEISDEEQALKDSLANDPHNREFYLKQIPFTEEQMAISHQTLSDGLYKGGCLEVEQLENFPLALRTLYRLYKDYPAYEKMDDVYYHLFLLCGRMGKDEDADFYRQQLLDQFPESPLAILLANPNYDMIAREGKHIEDSLYMATYDAYQKNLYEEVDANYKYSTDNFPEGAHRAKLMFLHAMSNLYMGHRSEFLDELKELVQKYSKDEIAEMAQYIVKGLEEGRLISDDKYNASDIWSRRTRGTLGAEAGLDSVQLKDDRYSQFNFVLAYPTGSLDEDQLLYEMALYNFTSYMVRNFEIELSDMQGLSFMRVSGFLSYDEVHAYAQQLYGDKHMAKVLNGIRTMLISDDNFLLIGKAFSFDEYVEFYEEKFAPIEVPENLIIDEPTDLEFIDPDDVMDEEEEPAPQNGTTGGDLEDFPWW